MKVKSVYVGPDYSTPAKITGHVTLETNTKREFHLDLPLEMAQEIFKKAQTVVVGELEKNLEILKNPEQV